MPRRVRRRVPPELAAAAVTRLVSLLGPGPGWVPGPLEGALEGPAEQSADGSPITPGPGRSAAAGAEAAPAVLPTSLRAARWDPGRRGAAALGVLALLAAVGAGLFLLRNRPTEVAAPPVADSSVGQPVARPSGTSGAAGSTLVVAVAGRVRRPGLVHLPPGARVDDAVRAAGGPLPGVSVGLLNLARKVVDGEQVLVGVDPPAGGTLPGSPVAGSPIVGVDLNAADVGALDALPGIGPVLAQHIVDWRTEHGRFASVDQLREVPGIGEAKYTNLKTKVRV